MPDRSQLRCGDHLGDDRFARDRWKNGNEIAGRSQRLDERQNQMRVGRVLVAMLVARWRIFFVSICFVNAGKVIVMLMVVSMLMHMRAAARC